jgi:hypothetical protein
MDCGVLSTRAAHSFRASSAIFRWIAEGSRHPSSMDCGVLLTRAAHRLRLSVQLVYRIVGWRTAFLIGATRTIEGRPYLDVCCHLSQDCGWLWRSDIKRSWTYWISGWIKSSRQIWAARTIGGGLFSASSTVTRWIADGSRHAPRGLSDAVGSWSAPRGLSDAVGSWSASSKYGLLEHRRRWRSLRLRVLLRREEGAGTTGTRSLRLSVQLVLEHEAAGVGVLSDSGCSCAVRREQGQLDRVLSDSACSGSANMKQGRRDHRRRLRRLRLILQLVREHGA